MTLQGLGHTPIFPRKASVLCVLCASIMCDVVRNNPSPAQIYGGTYHGYGAWRAPRSYVLAICVCCGACGAPGSRNLPRKQT